MSDLKKESVIEVSGCVAVFAAVKADQGSGYDRERQSQRDFGPSNRHKHMLKRWCLRAQGSSRFHSLLQKRHIPDTLDWKHPGAATITQRVLAGARPGAIILQHDTHAFARANKGSSIKASHFPGS
jgi:hypothetical protein